MGLRSLLADSLRNKHWKISRCGSLSMLTKRFTLFGIFTTQENLLKIMTKKHMEFVAALIHAANQGTPPSALATLAAARFAEDNPRFDVERFLTACGNPLAPPPETINVLGGGR